MTNRSRKEFLMFDPNETLRTLSKARPIFHSEADFQHALAWEIHRTLPMYSIRLECALSPGQSDHLDILVTGRDDLFAIELKYKTRALFGTFAGELFWLKDHSAQDCGRYDFLKDVQRLESFISTRKLKCKAYAILLTNDSSYWKPAGSGSTVDASFRLHECRAVHGTLSWASTAAKGTIKGREEPIVLRGTYQLTWQDYYEAANVSTGGSYTRFRYLLVEVIQ